MYDYVVSLCFVAVMIQEQCKWLMDNNTCGDMACSACGVVRPCRRPCSPCWLRSQRGPWPTAAPRRSSSLEALAVSSSGLLFSVEYANFNHRWKNVIIHPQNQGTTLPYIFYRPIASTLMRSDYFITNGKTCDLS